MSMIIIIIILYSILRADTFGYQGKLSPVHLTISHNCLLIKTVERVFLYNKLVWSCPLPRLFNGLFIVVVAFRSYIVSEDWSPPLQLRTFRSYIGSEDRNPPLQLRSLQKLRLPALKLLLRCSEDWNPPLQLHSLQKLRLPALKLLLRCSEDRNPPLLKPIFCGYHPCIKRICEYT